MMLSHYMYFVVHCMRSGPISIITIQCCAPTRDIMRTVQYLIVPTLEAPGCGLWNIIRYIHYSTYRQDAWIMPEAEDGAGGADQG